VASGGEDGLVCVRDAGSGAPRLRLKHEVSIAGVTFSPDGRWLAARTSDVYGGRDLDVVVWDLTTGGEAARLRHEDHVHEVSWHPAGALVATASQDRRARVWTVPDFQEVTRLQFDDLVLCSRFTADGARLVTTSYDGWLRFTLVGAEALVERVLQRVPRRLTPEEWRQYLPGEPYPDATPEIAPALDGTPLPHE
jgi:YD repeat-containing protein